MFLEHDGVPMSQDDSEKALQVIAPRSVSQFFLFDGELLRKYEDLLDQDSEEGTELELAIERVLGIPIVANAKADVTEVWRLAEKQLADQYAAHGETRRMGLALNEAQEVRARLQTGHDTVAARIDSTKERIAELEALLREQQKAERILGNLDRLRTQESDLELREQEAAAALSDLSGICGKQCCPGQHLTGWWRSTQRWRPPRQIFAASPPRSGTWRISTARMTARYVIATYRTTCAESSLRVWRPLASACPSRDRRSSARASPPQTQDLAGPCVAGRPADSRARPDLRSLRLERQGVRADIEGLEQQLSEIGEEKVRTWVTERDERQTQVTRDKERLDDTANKIHDQDLIIEDLKRRLRRESIRPDHTIEAKEQVSQNLIRLFGSSIDAYRGKLRRRVEERASEIFRYLTSSRTTRAYASPIVTAWRSSTPTGK